MKRRDIKSHCPVNFALEHIGDPWTLLIVRDIAMWGKHSFGEFMTSDERIAKNILASRLDTMESSGLLERKIDPIDSRKVHYFLTPKGIKLVPPMLEMAIWSAEFDGETLAPRIFIDALVADRNKLYEKVMERVKAGDAVFPGMVQELHAAKSKTQSD